MILTQSSQVFILIVKNKEETQYRYLQLCKFIGIVAPYVCVYMNVDMPKNH